MAIYFHPGCKICFHLHCILFSQSDHVVFYTITTFIILQFIFLQHFQILEDGLLYIQHKVQNLHIESYD